MCVEQEPWHKMDNGQQPMSASANDPARPIRYADRTDAGRQLAAELARYRGKNALVLAISNGGVPVGRELARALEADLDLIIARKLRLARQPTLTLGAVTEDGTTELNHALIQELGLASPCLDQVISDETAEAHYEALRLRRGSPPSRWTARPVILTDDGVVTGATLRAAIRSVRERMPSELVVAIPVAPAQVADALEREADEWVCLQCTTSNMALSESYRSFDRVSDESVEIMLCEARLSHEGSGPRSASRT
jgi:putative phosphoribosyl transferase